MSRAVPDRATRLAVGAALLVPLALLAGAYIGEYGFGLYPCEMCWWQRYPHFAAVALGAFAAVLLTGGFWSKARVVAALAALAILTSGALGGFHAGVEYGWWQGPTECASTVASDKDFWTAMVDAPLVRCDRPAFTLFGISLAGFNFLISTIAAIGILFLLATGERSRPSRVASEGAAL